VGEKALRGARRVGRQRLPGRGVGQPGGGRDLAVGGEEQRQPRPQLAQALSQPQERRAPRGAGDVDPDELALGPRRGRLGRRCAARPAEPPPEVRPEA
jgi:hypothetical protein